jgi:hypothetical protein
MSIEIFDNTLLKILVRQGTDNERRTIVLNSGEPGFTTDTKRLYVGDGISTGGVLAGNLFKGSVTNITSVAPAEIGDTVFNTDTNILYRLKTTDGSQLSCWEPIGGRGIDSNPQIAGFGRTITNLVSTNRTTWASSSGSRDMNTFYLVTDTNYFIL